MELSQEAYALIGALVVSNLGTALKLFVDWRKSDKEEAKEEAKAKTAAEVQIALIQKDLTSLTVTYGEIKEGMRELKGDLNSAFAKLREINPPKP